MNIREVMTSNPRCVSPDDSIQNAACIMRDEDTGAVPVVENGRAVAEGGQLNRPVRDIVTGNLVWASRNADSFGSWELG